jgi:hypothetical protein
MPKLGLLLNFLVPDCSLNLPRTLLEQYVCVTPDVFLSTVGESKISEAPNASGCASE